MYTGLNNLGLTGLATSFSPSNLFTNGEGGVNLEVVTPEENALKQTMYQDYTGTTLVTAVEQPVGLWKDTSGNNNHASQSSSTKRPILSARYNKLEKTRQYGDTKWQNSSPNLPTVTEGAKVAPDGTNTGVLLTAATGGTSSGPRQVTPAAAAGVNFRGGFVLAAGSSAQSRVLLTDQTSTFTTIGDVTVTWNAGVPSVTAVVGTALPPVSLGSGWYWIALEGAAVAANPAIGLAVLPDKVAGTGSVYVWESDLRTADDAAKNIPPRQRVNTSTDYDTVGFPHYLKFDGIDDCFQTGSIDLTSFDKISVWAGSTKGSDSAASVLTEFTATSSTTAGSFAIFAPDSAASTYAFRSRGATLGTNAIASGYAAPNSYVVTGLGDISGDSQDIRIDGVSANTSTTDQGTGNFANDALNIGSRNNASFFHNGRLYSLTVRASTTPTSESAISSMNRYAGNLMKIFF